MARIGTHAGGVATRPELLAGGLTRHADRRAPGRRARCIPVHRGVFRVGHSAPSTDASYIAAVKACGTAARSSEGWPQPGATA